MKNSKAQSAGKAKAAPILDAMHQNRILRIQSLNEKNAKEQKLQKKKKSLSTRQIVEQQRRIRENFFKTALDGFDTRPFLKIWDEVSSETCNEVLDLSAKSLSLIDGFELANRAITGPLNMKEAGVELKYVLEFARKSSRVAFFELTLRRSGMEQKWRDMMMNYFIAKEMGFVQSGAVEARLVDAIKEASSLPVEGPFPTKKPNSVPPVARPKRQSISERGRERLARYNEKIRREQNG
jgi:hypothetical protein